MTRIFCDDLDHNRVVACRTGALTGQPTQWFRIGQLVGNDGDSISAVSDGLGGTGWAQATAGLQAQIATAGSGQRVLSFTPTGDADGTTGDGYTLPVQVGVNNHRDAWGYLTFWKPENISAGTRHFISATSPSGGAGVNRMIFAQSGANMLFEINLDASNTVRGTTNTAPLVAGQWTAVGCFFNGRGSGATVAERNAARCKIFAGSGFEVLDFTNPAGSGAVPSQLVAVTSGNYRIGMSNSAGGNPLRGIMGPDGYIFRANPSLISIANLLQANTPVG